MYTLYMYFVYKVFKCSGKIHCFNEKLTQGVLGCFLNGVDSNLGKTVLALNAFIVCTVYLNSV